MIHGGEENDTEGKSVGKRIQDVSWEENLPCLTMIL
jgi:hypothetical protein